MNQDPPAPKIGRPRRATEPIQARFEAAEIAKMKNWQRLMGVNAQQILHWAYNTFKATVETPPGQSVPIHPQATALRHALHDGEVHSGEEI